MAKPKEVQEVATELVYTKSTPGTYQYQEERNAEGHRVIRTIYLEKWVISKHFGGTIPARITVTISPSY